MNPKWKCPELKSICYVYHSSVVDFQKGTKKEQILFTSNLKTVSVSVSVSMFMKQKSVHAEEWEKSA